jgi:hypothetical protein
MSLKYSDVQNFILIVRDVFVLWVPEDRMFSQESELVPQHCAMHNTVLSSVALARDWSQVFYAMAAARDKFTCHTLQLAEYKSVCLLPTFCTNCATSRHHAVQQIRLMEIDLYSLTVEQIPTLRPLTENNAIVKTTLLSASVHNGNNS